MKISANGLRIIKESEGLRLNAYPDPGSRDGHPWTIGYGHTKNVKKGDRISKAKAEAFLRQDVEWAEREVSRLGVDLSQNQFDALVSFAFNVGAGQFRSSSVARMAKAGRHDVVPSRLDLWVKNDGRVMRGLVNRRAAEGALYATPDNEVDETFASVPAKPVRGKPMQESRTAWAAGGQVMGGVAMATAYASEIKQNVANMLEGEYFDSAWIFGGMLIFGVIGTGIWFWYDRRTKSLEDGT